MDQLVLIPHPQEGRGFRQNASVSLASLGSHVSSETLPGWNSKDTKMEHFVPKFSSLFLSLSLLSPLSLTHTLLPRVNCSQLQRTGSEDFLKPGEEAKQQTIF